jgi:DNA-binding NarL/FixJ family response regulator
MDTKRTVEIVIAEDHQIYRNIICQALEVMPDTNIRCAENGLILLKLLKDKTADIVLLDLSMPEMDGKTAFPLIREQFPETHVIVTSNYYRQVLVNVYAERGAKGYIFKDYITQPVLINAVNKVLAGGTYFFEMGNVKSPAFTPAQAEILPFIMEGHSVKEIVAATGIPKRVVEKQRLEIIKKAGTNKLADFYRYACAEGLQFLLNGVKRKRQDPE